MDVITFVLILTITVSGFAAGGGRGIATTQVSTYSTMEQCEVAAETLQKEQTRTLSVAVEQIATVSCVPTHFYNR